MEDPFERAVGGADEVEIISVKTGAEGGADEVEIINVKTGRAFIEID